jgi:hypothetical protein
VDRGEVLDHACHPPLVVPEPRTAVAQDEGWPGADGRGTKEFAVFGWQPSYSDHVLLSEGIAHPTANIGVRQRRVSRLGRTPEAAAPLPANLATRRCNGVYVLVCNLLHVKG